MLIFETPLQFIRANPRRIRSQRESDCFQRTDALLSSHPGLLVSNDQPLRGDNNMTSNEEAHILKEVERRKERARQSGVIISAFSLFRNDLRHYEAWIKNCPELVHPEIRINDKSRTGIRGDWSERIEATIRGKRYVFTFREITTSMPDGEPFTYGRLNLDFQGQKVMAIDCTCEEDDSEARTWTPGDVSAFIEGLWVEELNFVFADVIQLHQARNRRAQEETRKQELADLKKNFGL
jgi:hypothetical protein